MVDADVVFRRWHVTPKSTKIPTVQPIRGSPVRAFAGIRDRRRNLLGREHWFSLCREEHVRRRLVELAVRVHADPGSEIGMLIANGTQPALCVYWTAF